MVSVENPAREVESFLEEVTLKLCLGKGYTEKQGR